MATIATLRDGIQSRIAELSGVVPYDVATGKERLDQNVAIVFPRPGGDKITTCGTRRWPFVVEFHVSLNRTLAAAQDTLDALVDPSAATGLESAIDGDRTLGGIADTCRVEPLEVYSFSVLNGVDTLMARIPITVIASA